MTHPSQIQPGSRVRLHLAIKLPNGTVAESTFGDEPLELVIGDGTLVQGLEVALYGMRAGQRQVLTLHPNQAYGAHDSDALDWIPRARFPEAMQLQPGSLIGFQGPDNEEVAALVTAVEPERVQIDLNHPLAGKAIIFESEILSVEPPAPAPDESN